MDAQADILRRLREYESRNVTYLDPRGGWPVVWERAQGVHVWDVTGKRYLDLTAAFGVAAAGHANRAVVKAGQKQMSHLLHAMGDVHPHARKAELVEALSRVTFERWGVGRGKTLLGSSGFEAVEAALKTAILFTQKRGVVVFEGAYHGLGYGALNATHRPYFRNPFESQLREFGHFVEYPQTSADLTKVEFQIRHYFRRERIGSILVEPIQARAGCRIPPQGFLPLLRKLCNEEGVLLILDEIYTGFGRTGKWFACEHQGVAPDIICLGKALTGGFPMSACVGRAEVMDAAWPESTGEALHTSTFLGHPVGCAMALAQIQQLEELRLPERSAALGEYLAMELGEMAARVEHFHAEGRALGLMGGFQLMLPTGEPATRAVLEIIKKLLHHGFIFLPEGEAGNVVSITPPLIIPDADLAKAMEMLATLVRETSG